jgi:sterol desaturase/sphingolipid hydroxylase (fatty acid hydroxylase superfamily)
MEWLTYSLLFVLAGPFLVEFVGYFWHRWVEHRELLGKKVSFRHYKHHEVQYPVKKLRNGGPYDSADSWTWYAVGMIAMVVSFLIAPWQYALSFSAGAWIYGHWIVAQMHSAFHITGHFLWKYEWFQKLVKLHDIHHYDNVNYGICFFFMDRLCGTYRNTFPVDENGNRIKVNVFMTYDHHRTHKGTTSS